MPDTPTCPRSHQPSTPHAGLLDEFLAVLQGAVPASAEGQEEAAAPAKLDRQALLYCERFVEFLTDLLSQVRHVEATVTAVSAASAAANVADGSPAAVCLAAGCLAAGCRQTRGSGHSCPAAFLPAAHLLPTHLCAPLPPRCSCPRVGLCTLCWRTVPSW